ncbi:MAG: hypothetical protein ABWY54_04350 [Glaciihabitans sp.]
MEDALWRSFITPILVALLTTLVIEYFAKPALEARKERIIRDRRQIDELVFQFQAIGLLVGTVPAGKLEPEALELRDVRDRTIRELIAAVDGASRALSRLASRYVQRHREHIRMTAYYLGFLKSVAYRASADPDRETTRLIEVGSALEFLDTYFLVHVGLRDGQEPWIKRWFWKRATEAAYRERAAARMAELGLQAEPLAPA